MDFPSYWRELRGALLRSDVEGVARLTDFPLAVRGEMDDDPVRRIERAQLEGVLQRLLAEDVGLSPDPEPLSQYLERVREPPAHARSGSTARIASLEFALGPKGWRLVKAYLPEG